MQFQAQELAILNVVLKTKLNDKDQLEPRMLIVDELEDGISINKKLKAATEKDMFVESDIEFSTSEKSLLLKLLERKWAVVDAEYYLSTKKKLS